MGRLKFPEIPTRNSETFGQGDELQNPKILLRDGFSLILNQIALNFKQHQTK